MRIATEYQHYLTWRATEHDTLIARIAALEPERDDLRRLLNNALRLLGPRGKGALDDLNA